MEFLEEYHLLGLVIGVSTFLIIGLFHPIVVKVEYYWGSRFECVGGWRDAGESVR